MDKILSCEGEIELLGFIEFMRKKYNMNIITIISTNL